jgi:hypothetical protein
VNYQFFVADNDPDYVTLWNRLDEYPEETRFSDMADGLKKLQESRSVMHVFKGMLKGYFRSAKSSKIFDILLNV